jgi:hypothetical protein
MSSQSVAHSARMLACMLACMTALLALPAQAQNRPDPLVEITPPADFPWPQAVAFLSGDCSLYRPAKRTQTSRDSLTVTIFNPNHTRAYPEHVFGVGPRSRTNAPFLMAKCYTAGTDPRDCGDRPQRPIGDGGSLWFRPPQA